MNVEAMKHELSIGCKNGIAFLMAAAIVWSIITVIFLQSLEIGQKNIYMLWSTGLMFPLSVLISKMIRADWRTEGNPLGSLGMHLNLAQLIYFPILIWAFISSPGEMVLFFAIITGAHFFPYGWLYHAKAYYIMAPAISVGAVFIGWFLSAGRLWLIPASMAGFLLVLIAWLYADYRKKDNES